MSINNLISKIVPPDHPRYTGTEQMWSDIEAEFGIRFPNDYKDYINTYGPGDFLNSFSVVSPFGPQNHTVMTELSMYRKYGEAIREVFPIYPEKNGLLYWGGGEDGISCWWLTRGEPFNWPIVLISDAALEIRIYKRSMTSFIVDFITGKIRLDFFGENARINFSQNNIFNPWL
ncbi:MAG: SMI1/KNR4 family protein [Planctomycetaceae bacterium]|jgi:hypothetical protein|nr:SMI1/KNR4 family protein [Planctomycetaceae bacterium]